MVSGIKEVKGIMAAARERRRASGRRPNDRERPRPVGSAPRLARPRQTILVATHDLNLIRAAKSQVAARVLRIANGTLQLAGSDL